MKIRKNNRAFSLVELIVVIAIMAVLVGVMGPHFLKYVGDNKKKECMVDREGLLAVYERCIYEETLELSGSALNALLNGTAANVDAATKEEVLSFYHDRLTRTCSGGGKFTGNVDTVKQIATITCDCGNHDTVAVVDFVGMIGTELAENIDPTIEEPSSEAPSIPPEASSEEPTSTSEAQPDSDSVWPYPDSGQWEGKDYMGQVVQIEVPTGLVTSQNGTQYVVVDSTGSGVFDVPYEWRMGPEYIGTEGWERVIIWSGVMITDIESIRHPNSANQIDGTKVHYGDILEYNGVQYIYASLSDGEYKDFPTSAAGGNNWYAVGPASE